MLFTRNNLVLLTQRIDFTDPEKVCSYDGYLNKYPFDLKKTDYRKYQLKPIT